MISLGYKNQNLWTAKQWREQGLRYFSSLSPVQRQTIYSYS
jgi:hypothetical protein